MRKTRTLNILLLRLLYFSVCVLRYSHGGGQGLCDESMLSLLRTDDVVMVEELKQLSRHQLMKDPLQTQQQH